MKAFAKIFIAIQMLLIPLTSQGAQDIWIPDYVRLQCTYSYVSFDSPNRKEDVFTVLGQHYDEFKRTEFSINIDRIPAFYFHKSNGYPFSIWHEESSIKFEGTLTKDSFEYRFQFFNYINNQDEVFPLKDETRVITTQRISVDGRLSFSYNEGIIETSRVNQTPWVNEESVRIESCTVDMF